jgi:hypothetical protein
MVTELRFMTVIAALAVLSLTLLAYRGWAKRLRKDLPRWRSILGMTSVAFMFLASLIAVIFAFLALIHFKVESSYLLIDFLLLFYWLDIGLFLGAVVGALLSLALKGAPRVQAGLAGLFFILSLISRMAQPGYGREVNFDWNGATGFKTASIKRPAASGLVRALVTPIDQVIVLQSKPLIAAEIRKAGWKEARGCIPVVTHGFSPLVLGVDHISEPTDSCTIVDPEATH